MTVVEFSKVKEKCKGHEKSAFRYFHALCGKFYSSRDEFDCRKCHPCMRPDFVRQQLK